MRAARYHGNQDLRVEDIDEPKLTEGKVLVDIAWCGICGSDLHEYLIGPISNTKTPHPLTGEAMPVAMGHEFCGRVRNPPLDSGLQDGDAVMVDPRIMCGKCRHCDVGNGYGCGQLGYRGYNTGGGFAEKAAVDLKSLHKLPNNISLDDAAILEPMAVVVHAVKETGITEWKNKEVLVVGAGPIGIALIIALIAYGAEKIVVSEPAAIRRKQVAEFVSVVLDPRSDDVVEKCRSLTDGQGADVVFDCAGVPKGLEVGFDALRLHGQYMNVAVWEEPMVIPSLKFMFKHITLKSAIIFSDDDFTEAIQMMADGKFKGHEKLVTGRISLEDVVKKGFEELLHNKDEHIKILVSSKA